MGWLEVWIIPGKKFKIGNSIIKKFQQVKENPNLGVVVQLTSNFGSIF